MNSRRSIPIFIAFASTEAFTQQPFVSLKTHQPRILSNPESSKLSPSRTSWNKPRINNGKIDPLYMIFDSKRKQNVQNDTTKDSISNDFQSFDPLELSNKKEDVITELIEKETQAIEVEESTLSVWAARGILLAVAVLWGTNFAAVKYLENLCFHPPCNHPPSEAALARFGVAALASLPFLINQRKDVILAGLECGMWITLGYFTQAMALSTISSAKCAFICSLTVVIVPFLSAVFLQKPIKPVNLASSALAIAGVGILEGMVDFNEILHIQPAVADATTAIVSTPEFLVPGIAAADSTAVVAESTGWLATVANTLGVSKGDVIALGQPFGFSLSFMRIEHYVEKFKNVDNRILTMSAAQCLAVGLFSLLWVLYDYNGVLPNFGYMIEPHRIGAIAWTGIMTTVVAIYFEGFALQVVSATEAALTFASEPVWAALFGSWLLHETLNVNSYVGGAVILGACILSAAVGTDEEEQEETNDLLKSAAMEEDKK